MSQKNPIFAVFDDPDCNPFIENSAAAQAACLEGQELKLEDIPVSFAAQVRRNMETSGKRPEPPALEELANIPEPPGFSMKEYRARRVEQSMVLSEAESGNNSGAGAVGVPPGKPEGKRPSTPVLPTIPTGNPGAPVTTEGIIAANRFGLGAGPKELEEASVNPQQWLKDQLTYDAVRLPFEMLESHECVLLRLGFVDNRDIETATDAAKAKLNALLEKNSTPGIPHIDDVVEPDAFQARVMFSEIRIRDYQACTTQAPFAERLVRFWTNHFAITANANTQTMVGDFERSVSRRHYLGKFSRLLIESTLHQGMLNFLNNVESIGPNSPYGVQTGNPPANENLAREVLELHTMGSTGRYDQDDIIELANALTGCINAFPFYGPELAGYFHFEPFFHEPGTRNFLGKEYAEDNATPGQVIAILNDVARHPSTISRICTKIATHFISDTPPQQLVDNLVAVWNATDGQLSEVYKALVDDPLSWSNTLEKFKVPNDLLNSAARAVGINEVYDSPSEFREFLLYLLYLDLGQFPFTPPTPEGWSDVGVDWAQPSPLMARMQWANQTASKLPTTTSPTELLNQMIGEGYSADTAFWVGGAATPQQGFTLALTSPEFQRR